MYDDGIGFLRKRIFRTQLRFDLVWIKADGWNGRFTEHEAWGPILNRIRIEHGKELEKLKANAGTKQRYVDLVNSLLVRPAG